MIKKLYQVAKSMEQIRRVDLAVAIRARQDTSGTTSESVCESANLERAVERPNVVCLALIQEAGYEDRMVY